MKLQEEANGFSVRNTLTSQFLFVEKMKIYGIYDDIKDTIFGHFSTL